MRLLRLNCPFQQERLGGGGLIRGQRGCEGERWVGAASKFSFIYKKDESINEDGTGETNMPFSSKGFIGVGHGQGRRRLQI